MSAILDEINATARRLFESYYGSAFLPLSSQNAMNVAMPPGYLPALQFPNVPGAMPNLGRGEVIAAYRTEFGLRVIRDASRWAAMNNEYAAGVIENRISFIVGTGFQYQAVPRGPDAAPLAKRVQDVIDRFRDENDWQSYEQELVRRYDVDGEWFLRFFRRPGGRTQVRVVEPEHVAAPDGLSLGVETPKGDVGGDPVAFWVVEDPERWEPRRVKADDILHAKANVNRNAKRGLPLFFPVTENLERAEKTLRNFAIMAQLTATYSVIRKHKMGTQEAVQAFRASLGSDTVRHPFTGDDVTVQHHMPGGIVDTSDSTEYEFPGSQVQVAGYVETLQADLRALGCRVVMPEYMISGDASNVNYGSAMAAEAPVIRMFLRGQERFTSYFAARRDGGSRSVLWRVVRWAIDDGALPPEAWDAVTLKATPPNLVARNKPQETERLKTLFDQGILSREQWAKEEGYDLDEQVRMGAGGDLLGLDSDE